MTSSVWAVALALAAAPPPARQTPTPQPSTSGWSAVQAHIGPDGQVAGESVLTYGQHRLRIAEPTRTVILELGSGAMTYVDPKSERWARITLPELVEMRDAKLAEIEKRIEELPPDLRDQFRERLEIQKKADRTDPELIPTERMETIGGIRCRVHRWKAPDAAGEACIAKDLPVDLSAFRKDLEELGDRLVQLGASRTIGSMSFLRLSEDGFPVRTRQSVEVAPTQTLEATSVFSDFRPVEVPTLEPPETYREVDFRTLMKDVTARSPGR